MTKHGITTDHPGSRATCSTRSCIRRCSRRPLPGTKAGQIIQVMTEGFLLHDRLLRPAQVGRVVEHPG